jgi:flagellar basal body-associated protein FliL
MALIKCSECGKEISDKAKMCVNCGNPIKKEKTKRPKKKNILIVIIILVIAIIGIIIGICVSNKDITGSYEILIIDTLGEIEELGKLYVYENNECLIETVFKKDKYHKSYNECTYNILEDTITFKYRSNNKESYYTDTCTIEDGAFNCSSLANIVPRRSYDLWVRFD